MKPHISGGAVDPGEVTVKESVKHCPILLTGVVVAPPKLSNYKLLL